jgi:aspartokinase
MTNITKQVWHIIDEDPSIRRDLAREIINVSGLAAYLKKSHAIQGSLDSIISAVRRYRGDANVKDEATTVSRAFADAVISTKTQITMIHLKNSANLYKYISELMRDPEFYRSEIFRLIKGRNETLVIIDKESLTRAKSFFPEGNIVAVDTGMAELALQLSKAGWQTKGVMARLCNEIANHGVSIEVVISSDPRISLFVHEKDLPKAHDAVLRLARE